MDALNPWAHATAWMQEVGHCREQVPRCAGAVTVLVALMLHLALPGFAFAKEHGAAAQGNAAAEGQAEGRGILAVSSSEAAPYQQALAAFERYFRQQQLSIDIEHRVMNAETKLYSSNNARQNRDSVRAYNLTVTFGSKATHAALGPARQAIERLSVVACMVLDSKLIDNSLNATGVVLEQPLRTQLTLLRRILPHAHTLGVLYRSADNSQRLMRANVIAAALGLKIIAIEVASPKDLPAALREVLKQVDVLWGIPEPQILNPQTARAVLLSSFRKRIPFIGLSSSWTRAGALYSLGWDYADIGAQCAEQAQKILKGDEIRSIPVETPRQLVYSLNLKTARHMKLDITAEVEQGAQQVFR